MEVILATATLGPRFLAKPTVGGNLIVGFLWMLMLAIGLVPIAEESLHRSPSITVPAAIAFFVAVGSAVLLRQRYSWLGVVLHIYGQIAIWLSLFVMSLAIVLALASQA